MADLIVEKGSNGGNTLLAFILGVVLLAVAVVGFFMWDNYKSHAGASSPAPIHVTVKNK